MKKLVTIALTLVVTLGLMTTLSFGAVKSSSNYCASKWCSISLSKLFGYTKSSVKEHNTVQSNVSTTSSNSSYQKQIAALVNNERKQAGVSSLTYDDKLAKAAQLKAEDMAKNKYFSHTSPTYGPPYEMLKTLGISYTSQGENIAMGQSNPQAVMKAWMNSSGHKANILSSRYGKIGVGYAKSSNGTTYWVQEFTN